MDEHRLKLKDERRIETIKILVAERYPKLPYHNAEHGIDVWRVFRGYTIRAKLPYEDRIAGEAAALLHDIVNAPGRNDNEEKSSQFARDYLPGLGFNSYIVDRASQAILPTMIPQSPRNLLEKLLCDSDLDNLGRNDFFEKNRALMEELSVKDKQVWYKQSLKFLHSHKYHTQYARDLRDEGKKRNIEKLQKLIQNENS